MRVTRVQKARPSKRSRYCARCAKSINPGDPYQWCAAHVGNQSIRKDFCADHELRRSDLTVSANLKVLYLAIERAEDLLAMSPTRRGCAKIVRACAGEVRRVQEMYASSAANIELTFRHPTIRSEEIREQASKALEFACALEDAAAFLMTLESPRAAQSAAWEVLALSPF